MRRARGLYWRAGQGSLQLGQLHHFLEALSGVTTHSYAEPVLEHVCAGVEFGRSNALTEAAEAKEEYKALLEKISVSEGL